MLTYRLSDECLGAKLRVTVVENRCVIFDFPTYVYMYIYTYAHTLHFIRAPSLGYDNSQWEN